MNDLFVMIGGTTVIAFAHLLGGFPWGGLAVGLVLLVCGLTKCFNDQA